MHIRLSTRGHHAFVSEFEQLALTFRLLPLRFFETLGLPSLAPRYEFNSASRRIRDPYFRWCGREGP